MKSYNNCSLVYQGQKLSDVNLLRSNATFVSEVLMSESNSRGLVLHAGSKAVFLIATLLSAYSCLLQDSCSISNIINDLKPGDLVIYNKSRGMFNGIDEQGRAVIKQSKTLTCYVPQALFYKIKPYRGNAITLDGRGVREDFSDRIAFISSIFQVEPNTIPSVIKCSFVIVCSKQQADLIMSEIEIEFDNRRNMPFCNVFTAAYYTPNDVYHYAGNSAKTDPVLKFTSKVSVARELIIEDEEKKIMGMLVNGRNVIDAGVSELNNLLSRRSLKSIILLSRIDDGEFGLILEQFPKLQLFAWTKEALLSYKKQINETVSTCNELNKLNRYVSNIINKEIVLYKQNSNIDINLYGNIKRGLYRIARNDFSSPETDFLIIHGFSLLKLFTYAFFPMKDLEKQVELGTIGITSPAARLEKLRMIGESFSGLLGDDMKSVVLGLFKFYNSILNENIKYKFILEKITNSTTKNIAIVIPKAYYFTVFSAILTEINREYLSNCDIVTASKFDNEKIYDLIIVPGVFFGKNFSIFSSNASSRINVLAYSFEEQLFKKHKSMNEKLVFLYNERNCIDYEWNSYLEDEDLNDSNENTLFDIDYKLEEYINSFSINNIISTIGGSEFEGHTTTEVVRVATFESGETVFFTKNYCPYVFDSVKGTVIESEVENLVPGDVLIFNNHANETRDIVEEILKNLVNSEKCNDKLKESYRKSKYWKDILKQYMHCNDFSYRDLANEMKKLGNYKHEVTLRTWLDENSHIVGPRDSESFYAIALMTNDREMLINPEEFCEACREIRSMRVRILKYIGINIINSIGSSLYETDKLLQSVAGDISMLAVTLQIEKIIDTKGLFVPAYMANRPQHYEKL